MEVLNVASARRRSTSQSCRPNLHKRTTDSNDVWIDPCLLFLIFLIVNF